jgi:uncharacterized protein (TIGR03790 family)
MQYLGKLVLAIAIIATMAASLSAGGGPHNVLVVVNAESDDSIAVGNAYRDARGVPQRNVCRLSIPINLFQAEDVLTSDRFEKFIVTPLKEFVARHPAADRLHYVVLCPDIPSRVTYTSPKTTRSLSAMLMELGTDTTRTRVNPFFRRPHAFEQVPGGDDPVGRLRLVTMLRGYERRDALDLVRRSVAADGTAPKGTYHFVASPHVRGFEKAVAWLGQREFAATLHAQGKPVTGATDVMAYLSGGSYSGLKPDDVASNTYRPGALVDMLESYGATWPNWRGIGYRRQLPVGWFIRCGATGVHGTTDEPYSSAFPSSGNVEMLLANYTAGGNLAEAYWSAISMLRWQNAVFGDPLCAPYAKRYRVTVSKVDGGGLTVEVGHNEAPPPKEVRLFIDGRFITRTEVFEVSDAGTAAYSIDLAGAALVPGWHRARAVAVDASPQRVQSWAVADFIIGEAAKAPQLCLPASKLPWASGDKIAIACSPATVPGATQLNVCAGPLELGTLTGGKLTVDTARLGPGTHELRARAVDAEGNVIAVGSPLSLTLVEPLRVVESLLPKTVGKRPIFYLRYNGALPRGAEKKVLLTQNRRRVAVRCKVDGDRLTIEPARPLRAKATCRLLVALPQSAQRSRDVVHDFTVNEDAKHLYAMSPDVRYTSTVSGLTYSDSKRVIPMWRRAAMVVLGPVDLFDLKRSARWSLLGCKVSAMLAIKESARPKGKDTYGAGLGVLYSDIDNRCYARIERAQVTLYQVLGGKTTTLKSWPAPGVTTGNIAMSVTAMGPEITVTVAGKTLGTATADARMPPGLPWIDLGAPSGVVAREVRVSRP